MLCIFIAQKRFLFDILVALPAHNHIWVSFLKEKAALLDRDVNDNTRGIQLIGPSCLQKVLRGVNWLLTPIQ